MHPWLLPILISALALALYDLCRKHAVHANSVVEVLLISSGSGALMFLVLTALFGDLRGCAACSWSVFLLLFCKSLLVGSSWGCVYLAMRRMPISLAAPIRATAPFWTVLGALLLYHEIPGLIRAAGMLLVLAGYYRFSVMGAREGFSIKHRDMHLIVLGTLLGSVSALYDKYLLNILQIPPQTVQFYFSLNLVAIYAALFAVTARIQGVRRPRFEWRWTIPLTGLLLILSDFFYFQAVSMPDVPISVLSLFRRSSIVLTFGIGAYLFREKSMRKKAWALLVILIGVVIIALN
jgi:drug/metabolite transporter (DMT)-like permease